VRPATYCRQPLRCTSSTTWPIEQILLLLYPLGSGPVPREPNHEVIAEPRGDVVRAGRVDGPDVMISQVRHLRPQEATHHGLVDIDLVTVELRDPHQASQSATPNSRDGISQPFPAKPHDLVFHVKRGQPPGVARPGAVMRLTQARRNSDAGRDSGRPDACGVRPVRTGVAMMRARLRRERPDASEAEIQAWLYRRPGADFGDFPGPASDRQIAIP